MGKEMEKAMQEALTVVNTLEKSKQRGMILVELKKGGVRLISASMLSLWASNIATVY